MGNESESRVTLVTGASRGIGRAIAARAAADGSHVALAARTAEACEEAAAEFASEYGVETMAVAMDVGDAEAVKQAVAQVLERFGHIDNLVNNAGITRDDLLLRLKDDAWDTVLRTDLTGVFLCSRAVLRSMLRRRRGRAGIRW